MALHLVLVLAAANNFTLICKQCNSVSLTIARAAIATVVNEFVVYCGHCTAIFLRVTETCKPCARSFRLVWSCHHQRCYNVQRHHWHWTLTPASLSVSRVPRSCLGNSWAHHLISQCNNVSQSIPWITACTADCTSCTCDQSESNIPSLNPSGDFHGNLELSPEISTQSKFNFDCGEIWRHGWSEWIASLPQYVSLSFLFLISPTGCTGEQTAIKIAQ